MWYDFTRDYPILNDKLNLTYTVQIISFRTGHDQYENGNWKGLQDTNHLIIHKW